jgi:hypothetical protein
VVAACFFTESEPAEEKAEVPDDLADGAEDAPPVLDHPPGVEELWAGAVAEGCVDWPGWAGLLLLDQPDELDELEVLPDGGDGVGVLGLDELDQPDELEELDRLLLDEERELLPLLLARAAPAGPKTRMNATAKARIDLDRMSTISLVNLECQGRHDHARQAPYQSLPWFFIGGDEHKFLGAADISSIQHHLVIHHDGSLVRSGENILCHLYRFYILTVTPLTHKSGP